MHACRNPREPCQNQASHTHMHTQTHTHKHTYMHTYIHQYIHTHIHTYIHTYIQQPEGSIPEPSAPYGLPTVIPAISGSPDPYRQIPAISDAPNPYAQYGADQLHSGANFGHNGANFGNGVARTGGLPGVPESASYRSDVVFSINPYAGIREVCDCYCATYKSRFVTVIVQRISLGL